MSKSQMSRLYVIGAAAALVSATNAIKKTDHPKYVEAQNARISKAKAVLSKIPDAKSLLSAPSAEASLRGRGRQ